MPKLGHTISVVVPAYNEAERIAEVLKALVPVSSIDEIIVVDDGSTDNTTDVVSEFDVKAVRLTKNVGKGAALQKGMSLTSSDIVVFVDADLLNLTGLHIEALVDPLIDDSELMMTVGRLVGDKISVNLAQKYFSILNGQRALKRDFIDKLPDLSWTRFGIEIFLSKFADKINAKTKEVILKGVSQVMKEEKSGLVRGFRYRLNMYKDGLEVWRKFLYGEKIRKNAKRAENNEA